MSVAQLKQQAAGVKQGLDQLLQLHSEVGASVSQINQLDPAYHPAEASSNESLQVHVQLSLAAAHVNSAVTQLSSVRSGLSGAVGALRATGAPPPVISSAAEGTDQQPQTRRPSYRLIHRSGNPPPVHQGPARRRLSRDELANVFGHLQPWELTRHRRPLGTPLFHQSAANYTHLVIDCEDDTARRMWETMPLAVAHKWGKRATNVREIKHRHPAMRDGWCRGTWVTLVEGHAIGRAVIADKKRREREGGEGTAAAAAEQEDDGSWSADEGTLEVLSFEEVKLNHSIDIPYPVPSSALPAAPVHLPALKTVDNIPGEYMKTRVGRQWLTPAVRTLIIRDPLAEVAGARAWVADCEAIEVLQRRGWGAEDATNMLSALPADGKSFAALHTLRGIRLGFGTPAEIDRLREVLVARGVRRSIRELKIVWNTLSNTDEDWERLQKTAQLVDAVAHSEALSRRVVGNIRGRGRIDDELLSRTSSGGTPTMQRIMHEFAKTAGMVTYSGEDEATPPAISDDTFLAAHTLLLLNVALDDEAKKKRAVEIASHMPSLSYIEAGDYQNDVPLDAPVREVWRFLEKLQTVLVSKGRQNILTLYLAVSAADFTAPLSHGRSPSLWGQGVNAKRPPIEKVYVSVDGHVEEDKLERFYQHAMASINSYNHKLKGHKRTEVCFMDDAVGTDFDRRFLAQQISLNFSGGPYEFSFNADGMVAERRDVEIGTEG
ncbi:unnamed protein product [Vitrella brassicaformis CCMP3155]|uniref:Uncharacterized protein n=1 Tax=Vitrella brassicaformis (strain CCMP3155) TaxID=1169540 RepID=A0A0G4GEE1_VITBC|nr:unnamed protein product [Vitrella brassicaformis CCMP3155]|eukprot:CEM27698.1 unnamed protein product [Vitrella brassicaformis CCMP3155]